jgi:low temperature requirement protein LtrA
MKKDKIVSQIYIYVRSFITYATAFTYFHQLEDKKQHKLQNKKQGSIKNFLICFALSERE